MKPIFEFCEAAQRIRNRKGGSEIEKNALLAILEGRPDDADRLVDMMRKRNAMKLSLVKMDSR
ncbi:hypothetical protein [Acidithiobacillus thiooxidans]|uniref:Uncharacterized protein n=2 Tax=Acidithiobacillus thiooxidans TaxID=930 RepID=A0A543Q255_ACITH|nr:hypothetical protein [Acidithiobacillus thiooxidans]MDX5935435.1 hypothetical protein [Acidithiobacillus thiooxidans]OCX67479.1 hypothetical protein A6O24_20805 [Acidithiobacillus thiooxidans]OCX76922.1 hypothetical protein A6P07_01280 [Acidithiobacillus thiooxidans]OCX85596.1 hypothetical protein A6O26_00790 [Acidithiobacillus thiooxidans]OCX86252.1 hypothetical protein A6M27_13220 [Acidithiobacillus thiooxidans]